VAVLAFVCGIIWSAARINLDPTTVGVGPLLVLFLVMVPLTLAYSALNMMLLGTAANVDIGFGEGLRISAYAQAAEMLPLPGGAMVRTTALIRSGGPKVTSAGLVIAFAVLWIASGAIGGSLGLLGAHPSAPLLLAASFVLLGVCSLWIAHVSRAGIAMAATALRAIGVVVVAVRLYLSFYALDVILKGPEALGFAFTVILGSVAAIIPAGLGIGEALSAVLAHPIGIAPEIAFLAVALNRLVGFVGNMSFALFFYITVDSR